MEKRTKESRKRINSLILLIAFTAIMLIVSTYAWFTSQKDITLSNLRGTVEVAENMEISLDAKNWSQEIDLSEAADVFSVAQSSRLAGLKADASEDDDTDILGAGAILPAELLPVSGIGETGSIKMPLLAGEATSTSLEDVAICDETYDTSASAMKDNGYFAFDVYIKNTSRDALDDVLQLNLNSAVQVLPDDVIISKTFTENGNEVTREYTGDVASGLQNTVRVALALYNNEVSSTSNQKQILTATKAATVKDVAIWEPNAYDHIEYVVANNNKLVNPTLSFTNGTSLTAYALKSSAAGQDIANVYDQSDANLAQQKTFKTDNKKSADGKTVEDWRIQKNANDDAYADYSNDKPFDIKNVEGNDFIITSQTVSKVRVYVWLEGQDVDCINEASSGGGIEVDLGLTKDDFIGEVMNTTP